MPFPSPGPLLFLLAAGALPCLPAHAAPDALFGAPTSTWRLSAADALPSVSDHSFDHSFDHGLAASWGLSSGLSVDAGRLALSSSSSGTRNSTLDRAARFASGTGNVLFLAAGVLAPLAEDGPQGRQHLIRTVDSLLTSTIITEALKRITRERRPDGSSRTSFPSGHATAAFAVATMQSSFHPRQAPYWYAGAALIAASRVQLRRHYTHDVLAGAAVGYFTSRFELKSKRGLLLRPFISGRDAGAGSPSGQQSSAVGLSIGGTF